MVHRSALWMLCFVGFNAAFAQTRPVQLSDYYQLESISAPALSPDAHRVAYVRTHIIEAENKRRTEIWVVRADRSAPPVLVSAPDTNATAPRWSSDGKLLAYTSGGTWFVHMDGSATTEPFHISGVGGVPVFSPDGQWIAFTRKAPVSKPAKSDQTDFDRVTEERFKGRMYDWMNFRFDGRGYLPDPRDPKATPPSELFVVAAAGGEPKQLTHLGVDVLNPSWRPDSKALAFTADSHQRDEYSYERADLWTVALDSTPKRISLDDGWHHLSPSWSPDGKSIAVLREEGLNRVLAAKRTQGAPVDMYLFPAEGGTGRNLTPDWDDMPGPPHWAENGKAIYFHAGIKGTAHLFQIIVADAKVTQVTQGDRVLSDVSLVGEQMAYTVTTSDHPVELYAGSLSGGETKLTSIQDALTSKWQTGKVERIRYDSRDGTSIDGWIVLPPGYNASGPLYPMVLTIHGGPHGEFTSGFTFEEQLIAASGYIVVYTNPRGSTGYGEKFRWGTWGGWGDLDFDDVMGGVDYALKHYHADPQRLGVTGYSYGGFLTNWIIGHTTRFAAAVVGAGPSDWISNYATGDIPRTKESEFFGSPWDAKANATMVAHSPITYATKIRTPTLFVHGESDARVPIAQAEEMYTTLKKLQVAAKFVRYPGEYHGGWSAWDTVHRYQQEMLWWKQYLGN